MKVSHFRSIEARIMSCCAEFSTVALLRIRRPRRLIRVMCKNDENDQKQSMTCASVIIEVSHASDERTRLELVFINRHRRRRTLVDFSHTSDTVLLS